MHPLLRPVNAVIAVLGAAVIGLGTVVAVDHTRSTPPPRTASLSAAQTAASSLLASGGFAPTGQFKDEAAHIFGFFTADTSLTWSQIEADLLKGETLDQIAGAHAAKVEADALAEGRDHAGAGDPPGQRRSGRDLGPHGCEAEPAAALGALTGIPRTSVSETPIGGWSRHSLSESPSHHQRPARSLSPAPVGRVHGAQPIDV
jgi:hypothetical protein